MQEKRPKSMNIESSREALKVAKQANRLKKKGVAPETIQDEKARRALEILEDHPGTLLHPKMLQNQSVEQVNQLVLMSDDELVYRARIECNISVKELGAGILHAAISAPIDGVKSLPGFIINTIKKTIR